MIRLLTKDDQNQVENMMAGHPLQFPKFIIEQYPKRWNDFLVNQDDKHSCYFVALTDNSEIVGHAGYMYNVEVGLFEIVGVVASNKVQRQGLGKSLINTICNRLVELGEKQVILYTLGHVGNEGTLTFYRNIGFEMTSFEKDFFQNDYSRVTFMKSLK
ncbi:GNAT family N-acetyltransferase [Lederbergia citrisecunda]|nr:GNAT family N-acetyltransferase [Lederbergia citrisecunda]